MGAYSYKERGLKEISSSHRCDGCNEYPITGPRYHCQVCPDFDFCQPCFEHGQSHKHNFERIDDEGMLAVNVGLPSPKCVTPPEVIKKLY